MKEPKDLTLEDSETLSLMNGCATMGFAGFAVRMPSEAHRSILTMLNRGHAEKGQVAKRRGASVRLVSLPIEKPGFAIAKVWPGYLAGGLNAHSHADPVWMETRVLTENEVPSA
ncbi:hypothetical protein G6N82_02670 [Altererythrobacter sp. BO-6]|uniref:hypothetical protein n=1 Tax=Altererythrobacter sp. BO-6 TaxID=2604537 RepID=UPI0013E16594|nr:hypothetical protein [Altererythrobacter sp. BO-6]QIG53201.1 hypothetical protein G6N82_02670 [Altererythrobacter sp. BO-6]